MISSLSSDQSIGGFMGTRLHIPKGTIFNRLKVIKELETHITASGQRKRRFRLRCECKRKVDVFIQDLTSGKTKSCGCLNQELKESRTTHGYRNHPLYDTWSNMLYRCNDMDDPDYGGRGITVCDAWNEDPRAFCDWGMLNGWNKRLQIDRIDNNKGYSPDNCRFVTRKVNMRNTRRALLVEVNNNLVSLKDLVEKKDKLGLGYQVIRHRIKSGWSLNRAFNEPLHTR